MKKYAAYLRVSTQRQGAQGLGISAQRNMCENFIKQNKGKQVKEFMDVESGTHRDRKGLWQAIDYCKNNGCSLVIAKLDRLARDVEFTFKVINTGIDIHFTDMPVVNSMVLGVFAAVAQYEREMCSLRTKQALAALKARGDVKLGASSDKYKETYYSKSKEERKELDMKRGKLKTIRHLESRDSKAFIRVLKNVFPEYTEGDVENWKWGRINCKAENRLKMLTLMEDYRSLDESGCLFRKWDFSDDKACKIKLNSYMQAFRKSVLNKKYNA